MTSPAMLGGHDVGGFDRWAERYDRSLLQPLYLRPLHRRLLDALSPAGGALLLDVGCGTGNLALRLAEELGPEGRVVGVDPSPAMLRQARAKPRPPGVLFVLAPAERLPFPEGTFDAAVSCVSMHHWARPRTAIRDVARVLRPGGRVALADMRALDPVRKRVQGRLHPDHHEGWEPDAVAELFLEAGLRQVRRRALGWLAPFAVLVVGERPG